MNKEAEVRHQKMLELEEEQELVKSQLMYAREKNDKMRRELAEREQNKIIATTKNTQLKH